MFYCTCSQHICLLICIFELFLLQKYIISKLTLGYSYLKINHIVFIISLGFWFNCVFKFIIFQLSQFLASRESDQFTLRNPLDEEALENTLTVTETIDPQIVVKSNQFILHTKKVKKIQNDN